MNPSCAICKQAHAISQCNQFRNNSAAVRRQLAAQYKLCYNCLGSSHTIEVCYSTKTCVYCRQQHHSLLHLHDYGNVNTRAHSNPAEYQNQSTSQVVQHYNTLRQLHYKFYYSERFTQKIFSFSSYHRS